MISNIARAFKLFSLGSQKQKKEKNMTETIWKWKLLLCLVVLLMGTRGTDITAAPTSDGISSPVTTAQMNQASGLPLGAAPVSSGKWLTINGQKFFPIFVWGRNGHFFMGHLLQELGHKHFHGQWR